MEKLDFVNELTRRGRSAGWGGYDGGHAERRQMNEAMQHFKVVADYIEGYFERGNAIGWSSAAIMTSGPSVIRNCGPVPGSVWRGISALIPRLPRRSR